MSEPKTMAQVLSSLGLTAASNSSINTCSQPSHVQEPLTQTGKLPALHEKNENWRREVFRLNPTHPRVENLALRLEGFLRCALHNERSRGTGLMIQGDTGTGKTHACKRLVEQFGAWAIDSYATGRWGGGRIPSATFVDWSRFCESANFDDRLDDLRSESLVVLDDVGTELDRFRDGSAVEKMRRAMSILERKWLLITTNLSDESIQAAYDARTVSRLAALHRLRTFGAPDYRKAHHNQNQERPTLTLK
jgi:hypothetical protein